MKYLSSIPFKIFAIVCSIIITACTLSEYVKLVQHLISIKYNWQFEFFMVIGMLIFQYPFLIKKNNLLKLNYYYNMLLVSLMGAVLLWPLLLIMRVYRTTDMINLLYFFGVVLIMFLEHKRRVTKLLLPAYISYTWVLYRFIMLVYIL